MGIPVEETVLQFAPAGAVAVTAVRDRAAGGWLSRMMRR